MSEGPELKHYIMHARHRVVEQFWVFCGDHIKGPFQTEIQAYTVWNNWTERENPQPVLAIYPPERGAILMTGLDNNGELETMKVIYPYLSEVYKTEELNLKK